MKKRRACNWKKIEKLARLIHRHGIRESASPGAYEAQQLADAVLVCVPKKYHAVGKERFR